MKPRLKLYSKFIVFLSIIAIILFGSIYFLLFSSYVFRTEERAVFNFLNRKLHVLPKETSASIIEKDFSMDHASYIVKIRSTKTEIDSWVRRNRKFEDAYIVKIIDGKRRFSFSKPFNGSVEVDSTLVKIEVVGKHIFLFKD